MLGTIIIKELKVRCIIGIHPQEREKPQNLMIDLELDYDFLNAQKSENIDSAINYETIAEYFKSWLQRKKFKLLETLAENSCLFIFKNWTDVIRCKLTVRKPEALSNASYAGVTVIRERQ